MPLMKGEINPMLKWLSTYQHGVIPNSAGAGTFAITNTKFMFQ